MLKSIIEYEGEVCMVLH